MSPRSLSGGWIEVVTGCMFSGKTDELIRRLERAEIAGQEVKVFKPSIDNRYSETAIGAHNGREWEAEVIGSEDVSDIPAMVDNEDVIAVDEANFFPEALVEVVEELADNGYRVIVTGLDQTFRGEPFEPVDRLIARAEFIDKLQAICNVCGEPATRTQRLIDGEPAHEDEPTIVVGADERYEARCRSCHVVRKD
ncbi:MAG: thymidine kinase [Candidatus Nanohaloarchaea archaeon]